MPHRPPPTPAADAAAAARRIHHRRATADDKDLAHRWPGDDDLWGVVDYVTRYRRVAAAELRQDYLDVLTILDHLRGRIEHAQLAMLDAARAARIPWRALAPGMRVGTAQGAEQACLRLRQAAAGQPRCADDVRRDRGHQRMVTVTAAHGPAIRHVIAVLLDPQMRVPAHLQPDLEDLWEQLAELPPGQQPGVELVADFGYVISQLLVEPWLPDALAEVVDRGAQLLKLRSRAARRE